ncbi:Uncharacterised protein [Vibrio cholerae]|nr:Uncharacterised protein [Vibrio cholerae]
MALLSEFLFRQFIEAINPFMSKIMCTLRCHNVVKQQAQNGHKFRFLHGF